MTPRLPSKHWLLALIPMSVAFTAIAWSGRLTSADHPGQYTAQDSVPSKAKKKPVAKKSPSAKPFDKEIRELDKAALELQKDVFKDIDWMKIQEEAGASIEQAQQELAERKSIQKI